jgi:hypothetical protein
VFFVAVCGAGFLFSEFYLLSPLGCRKFRPRYDSLDKFVQVFPNGDALLQLVTAVLFEMHDEWIAFPRHYLPEGSMDEIYPEKRCDDAPALPNTTNTTAD